MTITCADGFALIPKRCDECHRLFWLEPYYRAWKEVGIEHHDLKITRCKFCKCGADMVKEVQDGG